MPDPKYQFGVSHQSLVWLEKHQANKKMMIEKKERKKDNKCSSGLADRTTIRCSVPGPTSGPASRFFLKWPFSLLFSFYICCYLISSIYCIAKQFKRTFHQSFPECYPEDGWNTVTYLDNSQSNTETDFKFTQSIGILKYCNWTSF